MDIGVVAFLGAICCVLCILYELSRRENKQLQKGLEDSKSKYNYLLTEHNKTKDRMVKVEVNNIELRRRLCDEKGVHLGMPE